jgi:hypothetical protein
MQIIPSNQKLIEKILRDHNGQLVRATFCVYENGGRIKARLVDVVYLDEYEKLGAKTNTLSGLITKEKFETVYSAVFAVVSPYFSNILYFSGSKPRAPTNH